MQMSFRLIATLSLVLVNATVGLSVMVLEEGFDSDTAFTKSSAFFTDGSNDYLGITGINDFDGDAAVGGVPSYSGFDANYLIGEDIDGGGGPDTVSLTWENLSITGLQDLSFSGLFAADNDAFDAAGSGFTADTVEVAYSIDGASFVSAVSFENNVDDSTNSSLRLDTDGDGRGDGAALSITAATFTALLVGTGEELDLRLTVTSTSGNEEFAVDDFVVSGTLAVIPEPTAALFGSLLAGALGMTVSRRPNDRD